MSVLPKIGGGPLGQRRLSDREEGEDAVLPMEPATEVSAKNVEGGGGKQKFFEGGLGNTYALERAVRFLQDRVSSSDSKLELVMDRMEERAAMDAQILRRLQDNFRDHSEKNQGFRKDCERRMASNEEVLRKVEDQLSETRGAVKDFHGDVREWQGLILRRSREDVEGLVQSSLSSLSIKEDEKHAKLTGSISSLSSEVLRLKTFFEAQDEKLYRMKDDLSGRLSSLEAVAHLSEGGRASHKLDESSLHSDVSMLSEQQAKLGKALVEAAERIDQEDYKRGHLEKTLSSKLESFELGQKADFSVFKKDILGFLKNNLDEIEGKFRREMEHIKSDFSDLKNENDDSEGLIDQKITRVREEANDKLQHFSRKISTEVTSFTSSFHSKISDLEEEIIKISELQKKSTDSIFSKVEKYQQKQVVALKLIREELSLSQQSLQSLVRSEMVSRIEESKKFGEAVKESISILASSLQDSRENLRNFQEKTRRKMEEDQIATLDREKFLENYFSESLAEMKGFFSVFEKGTEGKIQEIHSEIDTFTTNLEKTEKKLNAAILEESEKSVFEFERMSREMTSSLDNQKLEIKSKTQDIQNNLQRLDRSIFDQFTSQKNFFNEQIVSLQKAVLLLDSASRNSDLDPQSKRTQSYFFEKNKNEEIEKKFFEKFGHHFAEKDYKSEDAENSEKVEASPEVEHLSSPRLEYFVDSEGRASAKIGFFYPKNSEAKGEKKDKIGEKISENSRKLAEVLDHFDEEEKLRNSQKQRTNQDIFDNDQLKTGEYDFFGPESPSRLSRKVDKSPKNSEDNSEPFPALSPQAAKGEPLSSPDFFHFPASSLITPLSPPFSSSLPISSENFPLNQRNRNDDERKDDLHLAEKNSAPHLQTEKLQENNIDFSRFSDDKNVEEEPHFLNFPQGGEEKNQALSEFTFGLLSAREERVRGGEGEGEGEGFEGAKQRMNKEVEKEEVEQVKEEEEVEIEKEDEEKEEVEVEEPEEEVENGDAEREVERKEEHVEEMGKDVEDLVMEENEVGVQEEEVDKEIVGTEEPEVRSEGLEEEGKEEGKVELQEKEEGVAIDAPEEQEEEGRPNLNDLEEEANEEGNDFQNQNSLTQKEEEEVKKEQKIELQNNVESQLNPETSGKSDEKSE